ncbi:Ig-like domain-containing protein [Photobacterium leiognathi]|uniref:Ig-like domain-containing protein n=1 Tax=Photobacterium leiognathi TaxID=553611 RepID=UPI002981DE32|nr:Ig-like domain-containing protein [Photobacterium leiognathi]
MKGKGTRFIWAFLSMIFLLIVYREYQFNILTPNHEKSLSSIKISAIFSIDGDSDVSLYKGDKLSLIVEGIYSDGSKLPLKDEVKWHLSSEDTATINNKGILTGINSGNVEVKASYKGIESNIIRVNVIDVVLSSIKISVDSASYTTSDVSTYKGGKVSLIAEGIYSDGLKSLLTNEVQWHLSIEDIAKINNKGILTGINSGNVELKASYKGIESNIINVSINDAVLSSINISIKSTLPDASDASIHSGGQLLLAAEGVYSDGSTSPLTNGLKWHSSTVDIAQINNKGVLTGVNTGGVEVKASYQGIESNIINVSVTDAILSSINISIKSMSSDASDASIYRGDKLSLAAEGIYSDGSTSPLTNEVKWHSSAVGIAQIDDKAILTGIHSGNVDVKASYQGIESNIINVSITNALLPSIVNTKRVEVKAPYEGIESNIDNASISDAVLSSINISIKSMSPDASGASIYGSPSIYSGGQLSLAAEGVYSDGSTLPLTNKVTWHSSAVDIVQIDDKGILTAVNTGGVEVKASYEGIESRIINVRITDAILSSIAISVKSLSPDASIYSGGKLPFTAEGIYSDGSISPLTNKVAWHSSAIDIAQIDDKGILTGLNTGSVEVKASYEGIESNIINVRITDAILTSMKISVKSLSPDAFIYSGGKLSFAAEGIYSDGSTSPLTNKVTWYSSAIDIAQIDDKGILTGIAIGNVDVKASYEGIESNIINVRITDAILTSITISVKSLSPGASEASIYSGGQLSFAAEGIYSDGSTSPLTNKATWHSSAIDFAQIDDKGILTGVAIGTVEVKASYEDIESNIINVRITDAILTSITISIKSLSPDASIYSGGQLSLAAEGIYSDGSTSPLTKKVTWHSSAVDIAQIDDKGILTGLNTGSVEVKASYEGIESNIINVRITDAILTSITISVKSLSPDLSEASIYSGGQLSFAAEGIYSDGSTSPLTNKVTWHSSAVDIAQIDDKGILMGVSIGTVEVKASYEGIESNIINVRITDAILSSITISVKSLSPDASIYSGGQLSLAAEGIYSDGSTSLLTNKMTWHSSAVDIAQIDDEGILTGLNIGTVDVKASYEGIESNIINVRITDAILSSITISIKSLSLDASIYSGGQLSFVAEGIYSDGSTSLLTNKVTWHSSAIDIAQIDDKGILTGINIGTVDVKALYEGIESNIINVRITDAILTSMNISVKSLSPDASEASIYSGGQLSLAAEGTYSDGSTLPLTNKVSWHSSAVDIAQIDDKGILTGLNVGAVEVKASYEGIESNIINVSITDAILTSMNISVKSLSPDASEASIYSGGKLSFAAEGIYSDGSTSPLTNKVTWYSSAVDVAQIDDKGILTGVAIGTVEVKASYEGIESNIINVNITDAILTSMNISVKSLLPEASIYSGGKLSFAAEGTYSDGSTSPLTNKVTWYSSAVDIALIDDKGILTGVSIGTVEVKASYEGIESNIINVRITDAILTSMNISVKSLSSDTSEASIYSGGQLSFVVEGIYSDGSTSPLTNKVTWHSSAVDIAQIDDKGILTGVSIGNVDVKASYEGIESNIINVRITDAILTSMNISVKSLSPDASIYSGGKLSFAAEGTYSDGSTSPLTNKVTWHSSAVDIAQIDDKGILTGFAIGTVEVKASYEGIESNIINVRITDAILFSIAISVKSLSPDASEASIYSGGKLSFAAEGTYSDGSTSPLTNKVTWHSSAIDIAQIDDKGILTGLNTGTVEVKASYEGIESNIINVSITDAILLSLETTPAIISVPKGVPITLKVNATLSDSSIVDVTKWVDWSHSSVADSILESTFVEYEEGKYQVIASLQGIHSNVVDITVTEAEVVSILITPKTDLTVYRNDPLQLTAIGTYTDGSEQNITTTAEWHSNEPGIIAVTNKGLANYIKDGEAPIYASVGTVRSNVISINGVSLSFSYELDTNGIFSLDALNNSVLRLVPELSSPSGLEIHKTAYVTNYIDEKFTYTITPEPANELSYIQLKKDAHIRLRIPDKDEYLQLPWIRMLPFLGQMTIYDTYTNADTSFKDWGAEELKIRAYSTTLEKRANTLAQPLFEIELNNDITVPIIVKKTKEVDPDKTYTLAIKTYDERDYIKLNYKPMRSSNRLDSLYLLGFGIEGESSQQVSFKVVLIDNEHNSMECGEYTLRPVVGTEITVPSFLFNGKECILINK